MQFLFIHLSFQGTKKGTGNSTLPWNFPF